MIAIVGGNGLGLFNTSLNTVGAAGIFGQSVLGQGNYRAILNAVNGNLVLQTQDAQLAGTGTDLLATRTYNSLGAPTDGNEGGWRWGFEQTVRFEGPGAPVQPGPGATVVRTDGDGHETTYTWDTARVAYVGTEGSGAHDELRYDSASAEWVWIDGSTRVTEWYSDSTASDMTGRLVRRTDTSNNGIELTYDDGRLTLIQDTTSKQELRLLYGPFNGVIRPWRLEARSLIDDANGHATTTLGDPLLMAEYEYDSQGRLRSATRYLAPAGAGFITTFSYDGSSSRIASLTQSDGFSMSFMYDAVGRVGAVKDHGGAPAAQLTLAYGPQPNSTVITDGEGQLWTYRHDATTGHLVEVVTPPVGGTGSSTKFFYDAHGNVAGITNPNNDTVTYGYDARGNRALERDAIGNTTTRTFSAINQVLTETRYRVADPDGAGPQDPGDPTTARYVYDANSRLRFIVSAEGRVTENRYGGANAGYGLLTQTLLYTGQLFDVTALGLTQPLTETEMIDWVAGLPDKTQVQLTEYSYDLRGNMSQQISYATVNVVGVGVLDDQASVAEYDYDAYSQLRQEIVVRGRARDQRIVVVRFAYDGLRRVLSSSDANGTATTVYDDANGRVTVSLASGLTETRDFDSRGRLVSISQTGDGATRQTRHVYDNADRLRLMEDAQGGRRYRFYDAAGRLEYQVDATKAVMRFEHDAAGRLIRQTHYLNRSDTSNWYDSATETVTKASLTVGGVGDDVIADAAHDRVTTFAYDDAGRLMASTDALNTVTTMAYDGHSRVVMTQTGDRVTRFLYDQDDHRVGIVDALGYFTEYRYDGGGQLIETVRYNQPSPAAATVGFPPMGSDQTAAWRPADTTALHSFLYYDGQGRVVGAVDEQGFLTETVYDDALNTQQVLRYLTALTVAPGDDLAALKGRAGAARQVSLIQFDDFGRAVAVTGPDAATVTRHEYDPAGRLTRVVSAADTDEARARRTFYNAFGDVTATLGGEGDASLGANPSPQALSEAIRDFGTRFEYDTLGRMARSTDANGNQTLLYYDRENRQTHTVNVIGQSADNSLAGEVSETTYDAFGQAVAVRRYAARMAAADVEQLLAEGGGLAGPSLLGILAGLADPSADELTVSEYDRGGRLVKQVDGENGFVENSYNVFGEPAAQIRSTQAGQTTTNQFDYDLNGRVVSQTADVGGINANTATDYDAFGRVIRVADATGRAITTTYPDNGRSVVVTDPLQRVTRTDYDALGRVIRQSDALGQATGYQYDDTARRVTATTPAGRQVTTARTRHGETESITDGRGNVTRYGFNRDGQPTTVTDALGRVIALTTYDKSGHRLAVTDGRGTVTQFAYDQRNRVVEQRVDPTGLNLTTLFEFDALGRQTRVTEGAGGPAARVTSYGYDRKGRVTTTVVDAAAGGLELSTTQRYNDLDNLVAVHHGTPASPNQHVRLYEYDNLGRRVKEIIAPAAVFGAAPPEARDLTTQERHDAAGRLTRRIDANGGSTWYVYDAAGQLTHSVNALGDVTESKYDAAGRLAFRRNCHTRLAAAKVAAFGDIAELTSPAPTSFDQRSYVVYDGDGQARFRLDANGEGRWVVSENRYDPAGNVVETRVYDRFLASTQVTALDSAASPGITLSEIQAELRTTLGYREEDPATLAGVQRTHFAYDANNRRRYTVDPLGSVTESVYDAAGNTIATVQFALRPALAEHSEAAIDAAVDRDDPANRATRHAYDAAGRLRYTVDTLGSVSENEYDARGNVVTAVRWAARPVPAEFTESAIAAALASLPATDNNEIRRFVYDAGNRLRFTIDPAGAVSENVYDEAGNVSTATRFARRPALAPTPFTEAAVNAAVGPLRTEAANQVTHFAYDAAQRLRFVVDPLGSVAERAYDAHGNLLAATRFAARPTLTQFDEAAIAAAVAPLSATAGNRAQRFAYDALNRLRFSVDALGSVSERIYDALGNLTGTVGFAVRPTLAQTTESAINAAVAPERDHPGNRVEHQLFDAQGRVRFSALRVAVEAGQARYQVTEHRLNAFGQAVSSIAYATAVAIDTISAAAITAAVGEGDPAQDRVTRFVYDLAGSPIYQLRAMTVEASRIKYRVSAQRFDAFGQLVRSTDYALPIALPIALPLNAFDEARVNAAVQGVADPARDHVSAVAYDALGQAIYSVRGLGPDSHQVTKQEHDTLGRVFRTTQYAGAVGALAAFDRATIAAAADAVATVDDRVAQYVYDVAGRQRFVLQADKSGHWTVGESRYDALGNLVESRRYDRFMTDAEIAALDAAHLAGAGEQDVIAHLAAMGYSDSAPDTLAGIQRSRFAYDRQNRLRFTTDALGSVVEQVYDAVGDLTTTVRFAARPAPADDTERAIDAAVDRDDPGNRVQHAAYDAAGQVRFNVQVIEPNVGSGGEHWVNERRYDALGRLAANVAYATAVGHLAAYDEATLTASVVADAVNDRSSAIAYDAGGRPAFTLRALRLGADTRHIVTKQVHDALGQAVQRVEYALPVALAQFDSAAVESAIIPTSDDRTTTHVRDAAGRLRFEIRPDLSFRESVYDALDQVLEDRRFYIGATGNAPHTEADMVAHRDNRAVGDGQTRGLAHTYDAGGRLTRTVDALGNTEQYEYDALGGRQRWIDKTGNASTCVYDRKGRKTVETTPPTPFKLRGEALATPPPDRVLETRFEYDAFGNTIREIEAANFASDASTTDFEFDTVGRPTRTLYHGYYDAVAGAVEVEPAANRFRREASIVYDALGNTVRTSTRTAANTFQHTWRTYDTQGQVIHEVNALNHVTRHTYNTFGESETVTRYSVTIHAAPPNGVYWTAGEIDPQLNWGYDENGNLLEDARARTIRLAYDTLGRKIAVTSPAAEFYSTHMPGDAGQANYFRPSPASVDGVQDAQVTRYEYNAFGDLALQRVRANTIVEWQDTSFTYDPMGRRTQIVDAAGQVTYLGYDLAGNLVRQTETSDRAGTTRTTEFNYNVLNQQIEVVRYGLRYTDANGVEYGAAVWNGSMWLDPDAERMTTVRTAVYDGYGTPLIVTDAAGNPTTMRYNALGQLVEVIGPPSLVAPLGANGDDAIDPFRNQVSASLITSMTLDAFGRPVRQVRATSQGGDLREMLQSYDAAGNLVSATDAEGHVKLRVYDAAGRVIRETQAIHADLGPLGINEQALKRRYFYDALGQLTETLDVYADGADLVQSGKSVEYNAFGEVTLEQRMWGPANEFVRPLSTAVVTSYFYDNAGHVFKKKTADGLTVYYYNLLGKITREEKYGNTDPTEGSTPGRVTEHQYDVLGRATMTRKPEFDAGTHGETESIYRRVTPFFSRQLDRWGNAIATQEGGYEFVNGNPSFDPQPISRSYEYDDNDLVVEEHLGTHEFVSAKGVRAHGKITKRLFRDLLGNVVKEVDEARNPRPGALISSRTRLKNYDSIGRLTAEIDATDLKVEYAYNIHGERLGTRNARGTVLFDRYDRNGNIRFHGVLRTSDTAGGGEYNSHAGTGTIRRIYLAAYQYDQANRRFARQTFTDNADAPWAYTWLDGRNLGIQQRDVMGVLTQYRFDPFGNMAAQIDGQGARTEWDATTEEYVAGRIETYRQPSDTKQPEFEVFVPQPGRYGYNTYGELKYHAVGDARTEYERQPNGLMSLARILWSSKDKTGPITEYAYNARGQVNMVKESSVYLFQKTIVSYDNQGRLSRVKHVTHSAISDRTTCDVTYAYDEWGNVRRIQATYSPTPNDPPQKFDGWFTYDDEGRMTISNGVLVNGEISLKKLARIHTRDSIRISYDEVGRRGMTTAYEHENRVTSPVVWRTWKTMRQEGYTYDDLGHLTLIEQRIRHIDIVETPAGGEGETKPTTTKSGKWQPLSIRVTNLRGDITRDEKFTIISGTENSLQIDQVSKPESTTTTTYRADGQVSSTDTQAVDTNKSIKTYNYIYPEKTGLLDSYNLAAFRSDGAPFNTSFKYEYTFQKGARVVRRIRDTANRLQTSKAYDPLGRLATEMVGFLMPSGVGREERHYRYDPDGRIIFKNIYTIPEPTPSTGTGEETYVYAGKRIIGRIGTGSFQQETNFSFAFTPMSKSGAGASRYVVQNGQSLSDIALASYGDSALWFMIADANAVTTEPGDPLPITEVGKTYEIPNAIGSSHSATTFTPFGMAEIIGNDRPIIIPPPPPPEQSDLDAILVGAVSIAIQAIVTAGLTAVGLPAPLSYALSTSLSNIGSQATAWGLGMQEGINWDSVGSSVMEGGILSMVAPGALAPLGREVWHQGKSGFSGWTSGPGLNWTGIGGSLLHAGFNTMSPVLGSVGVGEVRFSLGQLAYSAYNPRSGWAIPGSGRSPMAGAFEYVFGAVVKGLADESFNRIRGQMERPSAPVQAPRSGSVDAKGPLPAELLDLWDELDRLEDEQRDREALYAQNKQIAAASDERLERQLRLNELEHRIAHFGEGIDDRALIRAVLSQRHLERRQQERAAVLRAAKLRAQMAREATERARVQYRDISGTDKEWSWGDVEKISAENPIAISGVTNPIYRKLYALADANAIHLMEPEEFNRTLEFRNFRYKDRNKDKNSEFWSSWTNEELWEHYRYTVDTGDGIFYDPQAAEDMVARKWIEFKHRKYEEYMLDKWYVWDKASRLMGGHFKIAEWIGWGVIGILAAPVVIKGGAAAYGSRAAYSIGHSLFSPAASTSGQLIGGGAVVAYGLASAPGSPDIVPGPLDNLASLARTGAIRVLTEAELRTVRGAGYGFEEMGAYVIKYDDGTWYAGKGGINRAMDSALRYVTQSRRVLSSDFYHASSVDDAFRIEHQLMTELGGHLSRLSHNKRASPGANK